MTHVHCTLYQVLGHLGANDDACRRAIRARRDDLSGAPAPVRAAAAFVLQEECGAGTGGATSTGLLHLCGGVRNPSSRLSFWAKRYTCHFDFVLNLKSFTRIVLKSLRKGKIITKHVHIFIYLDIINAFGDPLMLRYFGKL